MLLGTKTANYLKKFKMSSKFHILMFPWFAVGHMTPYLHLSNELAKRGHKISFLLPNKAQVLFRHLILHPSLITFHPLTFPKVDGLPLGAETASDVPMHLTHFLATALDLMRPEIERIILELKPDFVFYDFAYWVPQITTRLRIKSVSFHVVCAAGLCMTMVPARAECFRRGRTFSAEEAANPPAGYPSTTAVITEHEARDMEFIPQEYGDGVTFFERTNGSLKYADVIAIRTCTEVEGKFCDYLSTQFETQVLLTGPMLPSEELSSLLDEQWASWLGKHTPGSVVYCALGSQIVLEKDQFQEILQGFELSGYPFLLALKPPTGCSTVEEAFPEGFEERIKGKGVVHGGWVQQPLLLKHESVGCFVTHCGFGSMWESLLGSPRIVLLPQWGDQVLNARIMAREMEVAVEVRKEENGWVTRESLCKAVKEAMDKESEVGKVIEENHAKWRSILGSHGFMRGYIDNFELDLHKILD